MYTWLQLRKQACDGACESIDYTNATGFVYIKFRHQQNSGARYMKALIQVNVAVLEWVRTRESGSESESTRPESESESESIRSESESIRCESESIGPESESESESIGPESESESESESSGSESESESASPTEVRVSPDSAWTHESNNRKVLYNHTWIIFAEPCIDNW